MLASNESESMVDTAASPAATGPAGPLIEAKIAAAYLLAMLLGAEGRGLPGVQINRVKLQAGAEGHPLDDVIVFGHDALGQDVTLDAQVKRAITFAPNDPVFQKVLGQIVQTLKLPSDGLTPARLAVATSQSSRKIDGAYQDVLTWARQIQDATILADRLRRPGSANPDMRAFVETIRAALAAADLEFDDAAIWRLLRRLRILVFDFSTEDSASQALARDQCVRALAPEQAGQAPALWDALVQLALEVAAAGGDIDRPGLVAALNVKGFQLADQRRDAPARAVLAEDAGHALADIDDRLGGELLLRPGRMAQIREAMATARYVEIRGAGGVGKSALLKHLAEQIGGQSRLIVLAPDRTPSGGWRTLRDQLGYQGQVRELLADLSAAGGGLLLIDGLDNFAPGPLRTVRDLVGAAAETPGFTVLATLRLDAEPDGYLPAEAISRLGQATVSIGELDGEEVKELAHAAPAIARLLADNHPARAVARNLYRLKLLLRLTGAEAIRTEGDLAQQWWETGDGKADGRRERVRLLAALADQLLAGASLLDAATAPAPSLEALIASGTLRDVGGDRVVFAHDVLRDWAIFNRLREAPDKVAHLPLERSAPVALARGVELLARWTLERSPTSAEWNGLVDQLSHGAAISWRRATLLAVVRSEAGLALLNKAQTVLLADDGRCLEELIRTLLAVDAQPASALTAALDKTDEINFEGLTIPRGPSWSRLITWLLPLEDLPTKAIPAVTALYCAWLRATWGFDPLSPTIVSKLHDWLAEVDNARQDAYVMRRAPFGGAFDRHELEDLESTLRTYVAGFGRIRPDLAETYLGRLRSGARELQAVREVVTFPGTLAMGAPEALADLTGWALIENRRPGSGSGYRDRQPFSFLDTQFMPESPARGPFLSLMQTNPVVGLDLIRTLIAHIAEFFGQDPTDATIDLDDGGTARRIALPELYALSRAGGSMGHALTCGLMALELWGHQRIEAGEPVSKVVAAILGAEPTPGPLVLVAVDLLLSHWGRDADDAAEAALPLMASPELIAMDRERAARDDFKLPDMLAAFGLPQVEPGLGPITAAALKARPSRGESLHDKFWPYIEGPPERLGRLRERLAKAAQRLGPIDADMTFADPAFMAAHALHISDPTHWVKIPLPAYGPEAFAWTYEAPQAEQDHLARLQAKSPVRNVALQMQLGEAVADPGQMTVQILAEAVRVVHEEEAPDAAPIEPEAGGLELDMARQRRTAAALLVARHADETLWPKVAERAEATLMEGLRILADREYRGQKFLQYDVGAMAFVGLVYVRFRAGGGVLRTLLDAVAAPSPAAVRGVRHVAGLLPKLHPDLPRVMLRLGLARCVWPTRAYEESDDETAERRRRERDAANARVTAELAWLAGTAPEPSWPAFPSDETFSQEAQALKAALKAANREAPANRFSHANEVREGGVDSQTAAKWLEAILDTPAADGWRRPVVERYGPWTFAQLSGDDHGRRRINVMDWTGAFFPALGKAAAEMDVASLQEVVLEPLADLSDEARMEAAAPLLRGFDEQYFNAGEPTAEAALAFRSAVADLLAATRGWTHEAGRWSTSIEMHLGPAIANVFFNTKVFSEGARSYLLEPAMDRLDPLMPWLGDQAARTPCYFVALCFLNTLEVAPRAGFTLPLLGAAEAWMVAFPGHVAFWSEHGIGKRVSLLLETLFDLERSVFLDERARIDALLGALVALGVADAARLEQQLSVQL